MSSFSDLEKMVKFAQNLNKDRIIVGTDNKNWHSKFWGDQINLDKYRIFSLTTSNGGKGIQND